MNSKGNILIIVLSIVAFAVLGFGIFKNIPIKINPEKTSSPQATINDQISPSPISGFVTIKPEQKEDINILFLGQGGVGHDGGGLTDSITLANIDYKNKKVNLIAIPRDTWIFNQKVNAAYSIGVDNLKTAIGQITGINVNYYLNIDFTNFINSINLLGGIDIDVPKAFTDNYYPVKGKELELCGFSPEYNAEINSKYKGFELEKLFTCRYETLSFEKGITHMNGETALKFVRSRHSVDYGSDFARGERAQAVLVAIAKKLIEKELVSPSNATFKKLASSVKSDITLLKVTEILATLGNLSSYKVNHIYLTDQNVLNSSTSSSGAYILVPKEGVDKFDGVRSFIQNLLNKN